MDRIEQVKKYELTTESKDYFGHKLFRIRALISFKFVAKGELGGFVESEKNVSHSGNAWVYGNARVYGNAQVCGDAQVSGDAWVCGNAKIKISTDYFTVGPIGSRSGFITFTKSNMSAVTGCFYGTIAKFTAAVKKTHGTNEHAKNYLALVKMVKSMWKQDGKAAK